MIKEALLYIRATNGGATRDTFDDDFSPIGGELWLAAANYIDIDPCGRLWLNQDGDLYLEDVGHPEGDK